MTPEEFWNIIKTKEKVHIIFLCAGNICRSPFAELKFEQLLQKSSIKNKEKLKIQSGGFINQIIPIHPLTKKALIEEGIPESRVDLFHSRNMRKFKEDLDQCDVLIVMDKSNRDVLVPMKYRTKVILLSEAALKGEIDIEDPALIQDFETYKLKTIQISDYLIQVVKKMEEILN